jgi:hypothetical protein
MSQQDLINKIRNLREKAANEASTEAEAIQAAEMAARLMAKHEVSETELAEAARDGLVTAEAYEDGRKSICPAVEAALDGISAFTQTGVYISSTKRKRERVWTRSAMIVGLPADREMAIYLMLLIEGAAGRAWKDHHKQYRAHFSFLSSGQLSKARESFKLGFGIKITQRLIDLARKRKDEQASTGTDLVVHKEAMIADAMPDHLEPAKETDIEKLDLGAAQAGMAAGRDLNLSRPLQSADPEQMDMIP